MRPCDVHHRDPLPLARSAALASGREQDPRTRADARAMSMAERMRAGFELSRFASRVRSAPR
jgi:hypothetical protein